MAVSYSVLVSEFLPEDSFFVAKHCPAPLVTADRLENTTCLAMPKEQHLPQFLNSVRAARLKNLLTTVTLVVRQDTACTPASADGWHAVRVLNPGHDIWVRDSTGDRPAQTTDPLVVYQLCGALPVPCAAAAGIATPVTMQFSGKVGGVSARVLVDSGAGANFISSRFCRESGVALHPTKGIARLPNDAVLSYLATT